MINLEQYAGSKFPAADEGEYELVIKNAERKLTKDNSKDFINVEFVIRDDIEQKFSKTHIFHKIWRDNDNAEWFDLRQLGRILKTQKNKPNYHADFENTDEFIQFMNGIVLIAKVEKTYNDATHEHENSINIFSYKETALGDYVKPEKSADPVPAADPVPNTEPKAEAGTNPNPSLTIPDSDLPF